jgi:serine/threonine-protein kinase
MAAEDRIRAHRLGQVVGKRYRLEAVLGKGGQSIVYAARDLRDGDEVAVKVHADAIAQDSEFRERMFREAQALAILHGTSAVRILDQQWTDDGALCLVMERLHGHDFEEWLHERESRGQRCDVATLIATFDPVVETLEFAHSHGIVHRDLKPGNIYLVDPARGGGVRLLDFGFAKFVRVRGLTREGVVAGSPSYIAPEAWRGNPATLDHRIDVYSLGAIAFRALAGRPPFVADDLAQLLRAVTSGERPSLHALRPDLPPAVDDWVRQALAIDPDQRFLRVRGMYSAVRACFGMPSLIPQRTSWPGRH